MTRKRTSDNELVSNSGAASAPVRRGSAARTRSKRSASPMESPLTSAAESVPQPVAAVTVYEPAYEEIAQLAYFYWEARGCQGGSPEEDWLRAEMELRTRAHAATA